MSRLEATFCSTIFLLGCMTSVVAQDVALATISGHVQFGPTTTSLIARLYAPKETSLESQQSAQQSETNSRHVMVTYIDDGGNFEFTRLRPGSYLLEIYVGERLLYQKVVSTLDKHPLEIPLKVDNRSATNTSPFKMVRHLIPCELAADSFEIYERNYIRLQAPRFHNEVYVYAGDIHRTALHRTGRDNEIYVMIGSNLFSNAGNPRTSGQLTHEKLDEIRSKASVFVVGVFDDSGVALPFQYEGESYDVVVSDIHNRLGAGRESVTVSICR